MTDIQKYLQAPTPEIVEKFTQQLRTVLKQLNPGIGVYSKSDEVKVIFKYPDDHNDLMSVIRYTTSTRHESFYLLDRPGLSIKRSSSNVKRTSKKVSDEQFIEQCLMAIVPQIDEVWTRMKSVLLARANRIAQDMETKAREDRIVDEMIKKVSPIFDESWKASKLHSLRFQFQNLKTQKTVQFYQINGSWRVQVDVPFTSPENLLKNLIED